MPIFVKFIEAQLLIQGPTQQFLFSPTEPLGSFQLFSQFIPTANIDSNVQFDFLNSSYNGYRMGLDTSSLSSTGMWHFSRLTWNNNSQQSNYTITPLITFNQDGNSSFDFQGNIIGGVKALLVSNNIPIEASYQIDLQNTQILDLPLFCAIRFSSTVNIPPIPNGEDDVVLWAQKGNNSGTLFFQSNTEGIYRIDTTSQSNPAGEAKMLVLTSDEIKNLDQVALGVMVYDITNDTVIIATALGWQNLTRSAYNPKN